MLILSLLVLPVLPACFCYDVELQGKVKVADKLIEAWRKPSEFVHLLLSYLPSKIAGKGKLPVTLESIAIPYFLRTSNYKQQTIPQIDNQITDSPPSTMKVYKAVSGDEVTYIKFRHNSTYGISKSPQRLEEFMKYLQKSGKDTIERISEQITADLGIKKNITPILIVVTNDYKNMLQNYYDYVQKDLSDEDRDLVYLDLVETSCRLLFEEEKKLLNDIIMHENNNHHGSFKKITKELLKRSYIYKREKRRYVCENYKVCKEYPAVSDYGAELISEILMLNDKRVLKLFEILSKILKQKDKIFSRISEKEDRKLIGEKLSGFSTDLFDTKEFLAFVRGIITQRFRPVTSGSEEFKTKIKATRILLDIVDKALNSEDDVIAIDRDNCIKAIKNWAADQRDDIEDILGEFVQNLIVRLNHNLTKNARNEIKILIKAIMRQSTKDFEHLLKSGSKYLQGKDFHSDVDISL